MTQIKKYPLIFIILFCLAIFSPSLFNFFSAEDWYFLRVIQINNFSEFINFFSFSQTNQSTPFYRPLSTQLFYFIFYNTFELTPFFYHIFILGLFGTSLIFLYKFSKYLLIDQKKSLLVVLLYGVSAVHFTSLYLLAAAQDLFSLVFGLLSLIFFFKKTTRKTILSSLLFFILSLLGKETAVMIPVIILLTMIYKKDVKLFKLIPFVIILLPYLALRLINYSPDVENSYIFDFSIFKFLNTLFWYCLWSLGAPELLVDYVGSGLRIVPKFFSDYPSWSYIILLSLLSILLNLLILFLSKVKEINRTIIYGSLFFIITLLPVIFLPWHKFTYYLTYPLIGFVIILVELFNFETKKFITHSFIILFIVFNILTILLTHQTHYSISRGDLSFKILSYFKSNYPDKPNNSYFEFINDTPNYGKEWGSSKQIAHSISFSDLFKVIYKDPEFKVFYEDIEEQRPYNQNKINVSTKLFLER